MEISAVAVSPSGSLVATGNYCNYPWRYHSNRWLPLTLLLSTATSFESKVLRDGAFCLFLFSFCVARLDIW